MVPLLAHAPDDTHAETALQRDVAGLVVESTFTSIPDMGAELYPWLPVRLLSRFRYDSLSRMAAIRVPVLIAHSPDDDQIPYAMGRRLYEAAPDKGGFIELVGGHNAGPFLTGDRYRQSLDAYLTKILGPYGE